jgi:hypothetical protein
VQTEGGIPVAVGENLRSLRNFKTVIESGGVRHPEPDLTSHGAHDIPEQPSAACPNRSHSEACGFSLEQYIPERLSIEQIKSKRTRESALSI